MRHSRKHGFTLVELLVVIGIIAVLISVLLPVLGKARESGNRVKCAANLRAIGQGIALYLAENKQTFPAAYVYRPGPAWSGGADRFPNPAFGYIHWSSYIYGTKNGQTPVEAFKCPTLTDGGLPPTNPPPEGRDVGQVTDPDFTGTEWDLQAPRCAYTVNEVIMPRNKFDPSIRGASTSPDMVYRYVKAGMIRNSGEIVLATEFWPDWRIVSEVGSGDANVVKSHRPISGYYPIIGQGTDLVKGVVPSAGRVTHARVTSVTNPVDPASGASNTLGWIGRNHGTLKKSAQGKDTRTSNFLYVDGHVESKTVEDTLSPTFQWGDRHKIYSLPNAVVAQ